MRKKAKEERGVAFILADALHFFLERLWRRTVCCHVKVTVGESVDWRPPHPTVGLISEH